MTTFNDEWIYEGPDFSVGIFGESVHHEICPEADDGEEVELAEELPVKRVTEGDWVVSTRTFKCPKCGATTEVQDKEPLEWFQTPEGDD